MSSARDDAHGERRSSCRRRRRPTKRHGCAILRTFVNLVLAHGRNDVRAGAAEAGWQIGVGDVAYVLATQRLGDIARARRPQFENFSEVVGVDQARNVIRALCESFQGQAALVDLPAKLFLWSSVVNVRNNKRSTAWDANQSVRLPSTVPA
jgi:hypothetical protein